VSCPAICEQKENIARACSSANEVDGWAWTSRKGGRSLIPVRRQVTLRTCLFLSVVGKERREAVDREWHGGVRHLRLTWNLMHE
jgi:hypothetical protein